jgi:hypothetical protein
MIGNETKVGKKKRVHELLANPIMAQIKSVCAQDCPNPDLLSENATDGTQNAAYSVQTAGV